MLWLAKVWRRDSMGVLPARLDQVGRMARDSHPPETAVRQQWQRSGRRAYGFFALGALICATTVGQGKAVASLTPRTSTAPTASNTSGAASTGSISVKDFGARGDGSTDDTAAI